MTINFNGGTHEVVIYKDGQRFDKDNLPYFFNSITSVEAKLAVGNFASIRVTIEPSFHDGLKILASGLLGIGLSALGQVPPKVEGANNANALKSVVSKNVSSLVAQAAASGSGSASKAPLGESVTPFIGVRFLYPNQFDTDGSEAASPWYTGMCMIPDLNLGDGVITITIIAEATAGLLKIVQGNSKYENQPALDVVKDLAKSVNVEVTFDPGDTETESMLSQSKVSGIFNEPKMTTIRKILQDNECYWVTSSGDGKKPQSEIRIKSRKNISESKIQFTFVQFRQIDPANNVIPIFNLSLESSGALFIPQGAFGSFQREVLEGTKEIKDFLVNPDNYDGKSMTGSNNVGGTLPKSDPKFGGSTGITDDSDPEITGSSIPTYTRSETKSNKKDIKAITNKAIFNGVSYRLQLPGLPRLKPLGACQVIVGDFIPGLSAAGWTAEVTHKSAGEGWVTEALFQQTGAAIDKSALTGFSNKKVEEITQITPDQTTKTSTLLA